MIANKVLLCAQTSSRGVLLSQIFRSQPTMVLQYMCLLERRIRCCGFFNKRSCIDIRHLHTKQTHRSSSILHQYQDWTNNNRSLIDSLMGSLLNDVEKRSQLTQNWDKIKKSFEKGNEELASYVKYYNIVLLLSRDEMEASKLIDYLIEIGDVDVEMGALFKELLITDIEKLMLRSVKDRNMVKCRRLLKILIAQGQFLQAETGMDTFFAENALFSENETVLLNGIICHLMETLLIDGATDDFSKIRRKYVGKISTKHISKLLFRLLEKEQITLDVYLQLMANEHSVLSRKEGNLIKAICERNPTLLCTSGEVSKYSGVCEVCGERLKKDRITETEFKRVLRDYVLKVHDLFTEEGFGTMYFENMRHFVKMNGPFHYFIDIANIVAGLEPDIKKIIKVAKVIPEDKKICIIVDNVINKEELPQNVFLFKVDRLVPMVVSLYHTILTFNDPKEKVFGKHSWKWRKCWYAFRPQDDILLLLGILLNGPETVCVSNDNFRNMFDLLGDDTREIMHRWQRVNQQPFHWNSHGNLILYPKKFSRTTQTSSRGWHVPFYTDEVAELDVSFLCIQKK